MNLMQHSVHYTPRASSRLLMSALAKARSVEPTFSFPLLQGIALVSTAVHSPSALAPRALGLWQVSDPPLLTAPAEHMPERTAARRQGP